MTLQSATPVNSAPNVVRQGLPDTDAHQGPRPVGTASVADWKQAWGGLRHKTTVAGRLCLAHRMESDPINLKAPAAPRLRSAFNHARAASSALRAALGPYAPAPSEFMSFDVDNIQADTEVALRLVSVHVDDMHMVLDHLTPQQMRSHPAAVVAGTHMADSMVGDLAALIDITPPDHAG